MQDSSLKPGARGTGGDVVVAWGLLAWVAVATAAVLLLTAGTQIYDTNYYLLWEAPAILAGDHPYRDFFDWGTPLAAYLSAGAQLLVGYRLIGEFALQWLFIIGGTVVAFHLAQRQAPSRAATVAMLILALLVLVHTPTYHYTKLLAFPLALWCAWRYVERPTAARSAGLALVTALGFLLRHDYGMYIGVAALVAAAVAHAAAVAAGSFRALIRDGAIYAGVVLGVLAPWAAVVETSEGLQDFVRVRFAMRGDLYQRVVYAAILETDVVEVLRSLVRAPLSPVAAANALLWLQLVTLLVPVVLLIEAAVAIWRGRSRGSGVPLDVRRLVVAGVFLLVLNSALVRLPSYYTVVAPLTAALSIRFLSARTRALRGLAITVFALTAVAMLVMARESVVFRPADLPQSLQGAWRDLLASPPVSVREPIDGNPSRSLQYLRECTAPGDRVFVTGSTPYDVSYYVERPIAGGHVDWHHGYRSQPRDEQRSLELLQRQSVPFAFATHEPVLEDLARYPRIRAHFEAHYRELEGSRGRVLVDTRRLPTGRYGPMEFPCFR